MINETSWFVVESGGDGATAFVVRGPKELYQALADLYLGPDEAETPGEEILKSLQDPDNWSSYYPDRGMFVWQDDMEDGYVRVLRLTDPPQPEERVRAALGELLELATDLLSVTAAPVAGGRADKAIREAREVISVRKGGRGESPEPLSPAPLSQDRGAALDSVAGPLCESWTAGQGVCGLPHHHTGYHEYKRPLGPEHNAVLKGHVPKANPLEGLIVTLPPEISSGEARRIHQRDEDVAVETLLIGVPREGGSIRRATLEAIVRSAFRGGIVAQVTVEHAGGTR